MAVAPKPKLILDPYQLVGTGFLMFNRLALLADDMGLGKTPQAIAAWERLNLNQILIVAPASVLINWQREIFKFTGKESFISERGKLPSTPMPVIVSYAHATRHKEAYASRHWQAIVVDESHFLKEHTSSRSKAVFGPKKSFGLCHFTDRLWLLSGTPAPNHAGELWPMLKTFGLTKMSYDGFVARYCNSYRQGNYNHIRISGTKTEYSPELKAMIKKCSLRRLKKDVLKDLPPIRHSIHYIEGKTKCDPLKRFPELKEKVRRELEIIQAKIDFEHEVSDEKLLDALTLMSQSVSAIRRYHGLKKIDEVVELLREELSANAYPKIVVWGIHRDVILEMKNALKDFSPVAILGGMAKNIKQQAVDAFQNEESCRIFFGQILTAGSGLTLTAAHQELFIEQDWVPGNNRQAADRCHRRGQKNAVNVRHVAIANSFDEKITATLTRKIREISTFID